MIIKEDKILIKKENASGAKNFSYHSHVYVGKPMTPAVEHLLIKCLSQIIDNFPFEVGEVFLKNDKSPDLVRVAHYGETVSRIWKKDCYKLGEGFVGQTALKWDPLCLSVPTYGMQGIADDLVSSGCKSIICYPIRSNGNSLGLLCLASCQEKPLKKAENVLVAQMASWLGVLVWQAPEAEQHIVTEERKRIGMDLHDGIVQSLYAVGLTLQNAGILMQKNAKESKKQIDIAVNTLDEAIRDIRAYILDLRPHQLRDGNLLTGMQSLIREFRANTFVEVELQGDENAVADLPAEYTEALFHIFQEALANIARHANTNKVAVRIWRTADRVMLKVSDDGCGFDLAKIDQRLGHGLSNMNTRAQEVGGGIEIISIRRQGTTILTWVPTG
jgi:signal transduction histidine kinase